MHYVADADANSHGDRDCYRDSYANSYAYSYGYGYCYCYGNFHTNADGYDTPAGYSYSKTSTNAEASAVALIGTVKAGTREINSRVPGLRAARFLG